MIPTRCKQTTYSTSLGSLFAIKRKGTYKNIFEVNFIVPITLERESCEKKIHI